ncbi:hypothetical protein ACJQWK_11246 [Exserohilum turcicum]
MQSIGSGRRVAGYALAMQSSASRVPSIAVSARRQPAPSTQSAANHCYTDINARTLTAESILFRVCGAGGSHQTRACWADPRIRAPDLASSQASKLPSAEAPPLARHSR